MSANNTTPGRRVDSNGAIDRLLVIGIDGGTWRVLEPLLKSGDLPRLQALMDSGAYGVLESTSPAYTIPAWNALSAGLEPKSLGIYNFMHWKDGSYDRAPYFESGAESRTITEALAAEGIKVISCNDPSVYRADLVPGICVAGFLYSNADGIFHPPVLKKLVEERFGPYTVDVIDIDRSDWKSVQRASRIGAEITRLTEDRTAVAEYLLTEFDWRFGFIVYTGSDRLQHKLWHRKDVLARYFRLLDRCIGRLMDACPDGTGFAVVSDHGFGPEERVLCLNDWLIREGYLVLKTQSRTIRTRLSDLILRSGLYKLRDILPSAVRILLERKLFSYLPIEDAPVDWTKTKAVCFSVCGDIFINREGRFPAGVVSREDYPALIKELMEKLQTAVRREFGEDPRIYMRPETEWRSRFPDLVLQLDETVQGVDPSIGHSSLSYSTRYGNHRSDGLIILAIPEFGVRGPIGKVGITDVAPTILDLFGVSPPWKMDGVSLLRRANENPQEGTSSR